MFFSSEGFPTRGLPVLFKPIITFSHSEGYIGLCDGDCFLPCGSTVARRIPIAFECRALLVPGDLDFGLVGFPHVCPLVQFRGTRLFVLSEGKIRATQFGLLSSCRLLPNFFLFRLLRRPL